MSEKTWMGAIYLKDEGGYEIILKSLRHYKKRLRTMGKEFDKSLGKVRYVHVEREKVSQMVIYTKRNIVYFTMEPEMPINTKIRLITKIKKITSTL